METANKVARITLLFWLLKIVATTLGETLGDYIAQTLDLGYAIGIGITAAFFGIVLALQLASRRYQPALFWAVIVGTTTLGTEISDFIDRSLHLGYLGGSLLLIAGLLLTLLLWYRKWRSLAVFPITQRGKEIFYWTAILFSNSLGTAFGDYLGDGLGLSYLQGAFLTAGVIGIVVALHYFTKLNAVLLFWIAFVFTRPFGATFGDFLTKPLAKGGLALGTLPSSLVSAGIMALLILLAHRQQQKEVVTLK